MPSEIEERVLQRVKPDKGTMNKVNRAVKALENELRSRSHGKFRVLSVGSIPKGTYLEDPDIDMFILFPRDTPFHELTEVGLRVGREVLDDPVEKYAEHPYIHGRYMGFQADIVPCFEVSEGEPLGSSVDRTPLHTSYVISNLEEGQRDQVILLKAFMKGIGVYGAENRTMGFSGYLCELLVLRYGSFRSVVEAASGWTLGEDVDQGDFDDPLVLIDPVDPGRNVASALSAHNFHLFVHASSCFLRDPGMKFFFPEDSSMDEHHMIDAISSRGTLFVDVVIPAPDIVDDNLYPQVYKAERALRDSLERDGFVLMHTKSLVAYGMVHVLFEIAYGLLPGIEKHRGPPVGNPHTRQFQEKHGDGVYLEDGRLMVDRPRTVRTSEMALFASVPSLDLGTDLNHIFRRDMRILKGDDILEKYPEVMKEFLKRGFPWNR